MGQRFFEDRIGALSQLSGTISLAASRLTIGGQQYITSTLTRAIATDVTLTANTLYMIFAVVSSGTVALRISSNVNSLGPSGFTAWKLVGAFYSDGNSSVAFGNFVDINGTNCDWISYLPTGSWTTNPSTGVTYSGLWKRVGDQMHIYAKVVCNAAPTATTLWINLPSGFSIDSSKVVGTSTDTQQFGFGITLDNLTSAYVPVAVGWRSSTSVQPSIGNTASTYGNKVDITNTVPFAYGAADSVSITCSVPIAGWSSSTPIKDL